MPAAIPLVAAGASLVGSAMSAKATKSAARTAAEGAAFNPYDTSNLFGSTKFTDSGGQRSVDQTMAPWLQQLTSSLTGQATAAGQNPFGDFAQQFQTGGLGDVQGAYTGAQNYGGLSPEFMQQIMGGYGAAMMNQPQQAGTYNSRGLNLNGLVGQAANNPFSQEMIGTGRQLLNNDYGDVQQQQLGLLRQQAAPQEDQATNSLFQRLQKQGRLGSTGGGRDITAFSQGLSQADTDRQLQSMGFAQQLRSSDQQLGSNLFSNGNSSYLQGLGLAGNIGGDINAQGLARDQYRTQTDTNNAQLGLQGNQQFLQALQGLQGFGQQQDATGYSRANDRIARATDLFGFGNAVNSSQTSNLNGILGLLSGIAGQQNDSAQIGLQAGGQAASAGANAGRFTTGAAGSPVGGFFQGLGNSVLGSNQGQEALSTLLGRISGGGSGSTPGFNYTGNTPADLAARG